MAGKKDNAGKKTAISINQMVKLCGVSVSKVESFASDIARDNKGTAISVSSRAGDIHVSISASADDEKEAKKLVKSAVKVFKEKFSDKIYTTEADMSLEKTVVDLLMANKLTVATAESCTGGLLSGRLVNVSGVSEIFKMGLVTYSNKSKRRLLGVKGRTLNKYGAVSENTAKEMAKGAQSLSKADVTVSVTGIAGPDGGSDEKPVGLVYIGVNIKGDIKVKEFRFEGDRESIRESSVVAAIALMRRRILEYYSQVTFGGK